MSAHLMIVAGYMDHLPLSHKLALMKLCDSADDQTRVAYPGLEAVRLWSGTKKSRALEVMKDLQEWGYVMQLTKGHRGKRATYKVFPNPGDEAFSAAVKDGVECPGAARFAGPLGIPSAEDVKARIAAVDGKGPDDEGSKVSDPTDRVRDSGPIRNGSGNLDPFPAERVQAHEERVQNDGRMGPGDWTPSVPTSVPVTSPTSMSPDADASLDATTDDPIDQKNDREDVARLCEHLADKIEANGSKRPTITAAWRNEARLLLDRDKRVLDKALALIDWCQDDDFEKTVVLSMPKFRKRYDSLRLKAVAEWEKNRGLGAGMRRGYDDVATWGKYDETEPPAAGMSDEEAAALFSGTRTTPAPSGTNG